VIPLRDDVPSRTFPLVNIALIGLNALVFFGELTLGAELGRFLTASAVIPVLFTGPDRSLGPIEALLTTLTPELGLRVLFSMFLHGGWLHFLGNMLYLWIFGDNVEDRMGHGRYLAFYLFCGWAATFAHIWAAPASVVPSIGASGAIAGVLGAYITLYPHARVVMLLPLGFFSQLVQVPAYFFLGFWFLQQFLFGAFSLGSPDAAGGVAWWAHIGGFAAGLTLVAFLKRPERRRVGRDAWWRDDGWGRG
jgi:rhomboid family protein